MKKQPHLDYGIFSTDAFQSHKKTLNRGTSRGRTLPGAN